MAHLPGVPVVAEKLHVDPDFLDMMACVLAMALLVGACIGIVECRDRVRGRRGSSASSACRGFRGGCFGGCCRHR